MIGAMAPVRRVHQQPGNSGVLRPAALAAGVLLLAACQTTGDAARIAGEVARAAGCAAAAATIAAWKAGTQDNAARVAYAAAQAAAEEALKLGCAAPATPAPPKEA
jgi:hypothetical protein